MNAVLDRPRLTLAITALLLVATPRLASQSGEWDAGFSSPGLGGRVFALTEFQGELVAGGFTFRTDRLIENVARFDGSEWQPLGQGMGGLNRLPTEPRQVRAFAVYNGELIAGGAFTTAGGVVANSIARWNGTRWAPLGTGVQRDHQLFAIVYALAVFNGELWVGGDFTVAGGQSIAALARWDGTTWRPGGTFAATVLGEREVRAIEPVQNDLWVGGEFSAPGNRVARFDGTRWSAAGSGTDARVWDLCEFGGEVVACGGFGTAGGASAPGIAAWNGSGWRALGSIGLAGSNRMHGLATFRNRLYVTGNFGDTQLGAGNIAQWDGSAWNGVGKLAGVVSGTQPPTGFALHALSDRVVVGGEFEYALEQSRLDPDAASHNVVAFDGRHWQPVGDGGHGANDTVHALVRYAGGFVAAGDFETVGTTVAHGVAFFDGDDWHELGRFEGGPVLDAVPFGDDLYVTGRFTSVDGQPITRAARYDGQQWHPWGNGSSGSLAVYQGRLHQGAADKLYVWNGNSRTLLGTVPGEIEQVHAHAGSLWVAVWNAFQPTLHRFDGTRLTQVATLDAGIETIGSFAGELVVGGQFDTIAGVAARRIARYDGNTWRPFGSGLGNGLPGTAVLAIAELDGTLYTGGSILDGIRRWDGSAWQPLSGGIDEVVHTILPVLTDGSLLIGGQFDTAGTLIADQLARWQTAPAWRDLLHGSDGVAGAPRLSGRGALTPNTRFDITLDRAAPSAPVALVVGADRGDFPFFGGIVVPRTDALFAIATHANWRLSITGSTPVLASGTAIYFQALVLDAAAASGIAFSNTLCATAP